MLKFIATFFLCLRDGGKKALKKKKEPHSEGCKRIIKQGKCVSKNVIYDSTKQGLSYLINAEEIARPTVAVCCFFFFFCYSFIFHYLKLIFPY